MNKTTFVFAVVATMSFFTWAQNSAPRSEEPAELTSTEQKGFGKWRIGIGGAFNGSIDMDLKSRNIPRPSIYRVDPNHTRAAASSRSDKSTGNMSFDEGGSIATDSANDGYATENWELPEGRYFGEAGGQFVLNNAYEEVLAGQTTFNESYADDSADLYPFGVAFEVSRELWMSDGWGEQRYGLDLVAAFSYFFRRDAYRSSGSMTRTDQVREGSYVTTVADSGEMYAYHPEWYGDPSQAQFDAHDGMYGERNFYTDYSHPALLWDDIQTADVPGQTRPETSTYRYFASGNYQELEMFLALRPWYEVADWWRVYGLLGVGVSWASFRMDFYGSWDECKKERFDQWDVYGVAGLGMIFRYDCFDISVDFIGRFLRDDMDVDGRYITGQIGRSDWGFRVLAGFEF